MSDEDLYKRWAMHLSNAGCGADEWEDLDEIDQDAWNNLADDINTGRLS